MYDTVLTGSNTVKRVGQGESELCKWHMINVTLLSVTCFVSQRGKAENYCEPSEAGRWAYFPQNHTPHN